MDRRIKSIRAAKAASVALMLFILQAAWVVFSCYFWRPSRIRRAMAQQGVRGPDPKFLVGNLKDIAALVAAATTSTSSKMDSVLHDNIFARIIPDYVLWSKIYGKRITYWYGSEPRLRLIKTEIIKELLSSKYVLVSGKSWTQRRGAKELIGQGLLMANGSDWFHQRHVVAPAFMADKLKSHVRYMVECTREMIGTLREALGGSGGGARVLFTFHFSLFTAQHVSK